MKRDPTSRKDHAKVAVSMLSNLQGPRTVAESLPRPNIAVFSAP